jgi:DNA-binding CsgD family transcriptional regulator
VACLPLEHDLPSLVEELFAAVEDDQAWISALASIQRAVNADMVFLHSYDHTCKCGTITPVVGLDQETADAYHDHYGRINPWVLHGRDQVRPGAVTVSHRMFPDELLARTEFYHDYLVQNGLFHCMSAVVAVERDVATTISFPRRRQAGNYTPAEERFLHRCIPHLGRTLRLRRRLALGSGERTSETGALDRLPFGVVLLDASGDVLVVNQAASLLLAEADALLLCCGRLSAVVPAERSLLNRALREVLAGSSPMPCGGHALRLHRVSQRAALELWVTPLLGSALALSGQPRAIVFLVDPERATIVDEGALRSLHGLTRVEARVAVGLVRGKSAQDIAAAMGVGLETIRSHVKSLLRKTGACRQAELVQLLLGGVARLVVPGGGGGPGSQPI